MTTWTTTAPADWRQTCEHHTAVFHTEEWLSLLERSFPCSTLFYSEGSEAARLAVTQFRAGPFRVGYLGFPIGGVLGGGSPSGALLNRLRQSDARSLPVALRIPVSGFGPPVDLDLPHEATAETAIIDLQSWTLAGLNKNRRRDVNRSLRSGLELVDTTNPDDGARIYELYRATLERNDGSLRYTETYFRELITLARNNSRVRVLLAKQGETIAAFTVVVLHGATAYYLHGAFDWEMREHLPSAMLLYESIEWSKGEGCCSFNLMSSPVGQDTLIKYKERWGAETREHRTYTLPLRPTYFLFKSAERLYRLFQ